MADKEGKRAQRGRPLSGGRDNIRALLKAYLRDGHRILSVEFLRDVLLASGTPGADLTWLAAYDLDRQVASLAVGLLSMSMDESRVPHSIAERIRSEAEPQLLRAIRDPKLPDERKSVVGSMYMLHWGKMAGDEYRSCFHDYDASTKDSMDEAIDRLSDDPQDLEEWLRGMKVLNDDPDDSIGPIGPALRGLSFLSASSRERNPDGASALLCAATAIACEQDSVSEDLWAAIEAMGRARSERAMWFLAELARWPAMGETRVRLEAAAHEMDIAGIRPGYALGRDFSHGYVSLIDGVGSRSLMMFFHTHDGGMDGIFLLLNDQVGMKDTWALFGEGEAFERRMRDDLNRGKMRCCPCSFEMARQLVADAWFLHERNQRPFPGVFFIYRPYLGEDPIVPKRRHCNLAPYMLETMKVSPRLFERSDELAYSPLYSEFWFASDAAYSFVRRNMLGPRGGGMTQEAFEAFIRDVAACELNALLSRMAVNLELECLAGRDTQRINRIAARTWLGLTKDVLPLQKVPYIQKLAALSVENVSANIRIGHRSQAEANDASMKADDEALRIELDEEGPFSDIGSP